MVGTTLAIVIGLVVVAAVASYCVARSVGRLTEQVHIHLSDGTESSLRMFAAEREEPTRSESETG